MTADRLRCAVVGAGIIGAFCSYFLLRRGHNVTLFDRYPAPFQGTTAAGFGSLTPYSDPFFKGEVSRFAQASISLYRHDVVPDLAPYGRVDLSSDSLLHLIDGAQDLTACVSKLKERGHVEGRDFRTLTAREAISLEPNLCPEFESAIEYMEPWIDTSQLLPALLARVRAAPAFKEALGQSVVRISETSAGVSVHSTSGPAESFDHVVIASGASTSEITGIPTPQLQLIRGDAALALAMERRPLLERHIYMGDAFITPRLNGEHLLGASYDPAPENFCDCEPASNRASANVRHLVQILQNCTRILPALLECEINQVWHGWRPSTPSKIPFVGLVPGCEKIWGALGFIGLGVTLAPAVGLAVAKALEGEVGALPNALSSPQPELWRAP